VETSSPTPAVDGAALFPALYDELRRLAASQIARSGDGLTLGATTLLHETYLDMARRSGPMAPLFPDRARFMAYSAKVMRNVIIDHARNRRAQKRGGLVEITSLRLDEVDDHDRAVNGDDLERIGEALEELASFDPELARLVDLKFFCGFSLSEIAVMRDVSERTVRRHWDRARLFLYRSLNGSAA
jgi:RNA polymerase sigma factor (TIGR02999 family)